MEKRTRSSSSLRPCVACGLSYTPSTSTLSALMERRSTIGSGPTTTGPRSGTAPPFACSMRVMQSSILSFRRFSGGLCKSPCERANLLPFWSSPVVKVGFASFCSSFFHITVSAAEKGADAVQAQDSAFREQLVKELKQFMMSADLDTITTRQASSSLLALLASLRCGNRFEPRLRPRWACR